jgi:anthranilate phosphoribosyltransferase
MAAVVAGVLAKRGNRALVFRGDDGLDELTTTTTSRVWVVNAGEVTETKVDPLGLGIRAAAAEDLRGGDSVHNADVARRVFAGEAGAVRDAELLNAAAGVVAFEGPEAAQLHDQLAAAVARCAHAIDSGAAAATVERWAGVSQAARA